MSINTKISDIISTQRDKSISTELSHEEKIDYIYRYIRKQERSALVKRYVKIVFYLAIIGYFYFMIAVVLPRILGGIIPGVDIGSIRDQIMGNTEKAEDISSSQVSDILKRLEGINF